MLMAIHDTIWHSLSCPLPHLLAPTFTRFKLVLRPQTWQEKVTDTPGPKKRRKIKYPKGRDKFANIIDGGIPGVWSLLPHAMDETCGSLTKEDLTEILLYTRNTDPCLLEQGLLDLDMASSTRCLT
ncbi:hypothetical protein RRG08_010249 [Elysia crispata]|uniref:Uncharacterized protein n=1 Tax=Elysia crispata TaxID=231223 RepID=A0AAE0ZZK2_9GAST|nr:hypothetical protein RRG08_010249 [Elysia crispata]